MSGGPLSPPNSLSRRLAPSGRIAIAGAIILFVMLAVLAAQPARQVEAQSCSGPFTIDFAGLPAGTIIDDQYASFGVDISVEANGDHPDALIVFDSNSTDEDLDDDLRVGIGNIAILAENLTDVDPADGLVDQPDENNLGGRVTFTFDQDVSIGSFLFVDKDHGSSDFAIAYNASGDVITQVPIPQADDGSVQTIAVNADGVRRFELVYRDSAGFTGIEVQCPEQPTPSPTPTPVAETPTPTPAAVTPTPEAPAPTAAGGTPTDTPPAESPSPSPAVQGVSSTPDTSQPAAVAAADIEGGPETAVLGAQALPSGGGSPGAGKDPLHWLAGLVVLALALGGSIYTLKRQRR